MSKISYYDAEETGGGTSDSFLSHESEYTYDMHGNVTGEKDYEVDGQMRSLLQAEVTGGIQTSYAHNGFNQLTSAIERDGERTMFFEQLSNGLWSFKNTDKTSEKNDIINMLVAMMRKRTVKK